ncbi:MAG: (d)CMP kinase [Alphaproteobacteria bacterium]|nr:(d)CMP kinase [Alphaproteobacteria bacterium]
MIIAIDGPAAAGKGTLAKKLAEHYGFAHLDTGALYRAVASRVLRAGASPDDADAAAREAQALTEADLKAEDLRSERVSDAASRVATEPGVRAALLDFQRAFARRHPGGRSGAVVEGRDIGTVVLPDAEKKLFVTASAECRAERRWKELVSSGSAIRLEEVLKSVVERDRRDQERAQSSLRMAEGAFLLDTTKLDIDEAFTAAKAYISGPN